MNKQKILELYWGKNYSLKDTADAMGVRYPSTIWKAMKRLNIPIRSHAEAMSGERARMLISAHNRDIAGEKNPMWGSCRTGEDSPMWGKTHSKETRDKISKNHADVSGDKNPNWKGGIK